METTPIAKDRVETKEEKTYLYHMVPEDVVFDEAGREVIYPLNMLKEKFPGLYEIKAEKYNSDYRKTIPNLIVPTLENAAWGDVVQLTAVPPEVLKSALVEAGFSPKEMKFYQIDPALLDPEKTTIYLYRDGVDNESPENFAEYHPEKLDEHSVIRASTKEHYEEKFRRKQKPFLFVGVPHIFHKGPIDVSGFSVIVV